MTDLYTSLNDIIDKRVEAKLKSLDFIYGRLDTLEKQMQKLEELYEFVIWGEPIDKPDRMLSIIERLHKIEGKQ